MRITFLLLSVLLLSSCKETKQIYSDISFVDDLINSKKKYDKYSSTKFEFDDKAIFLNERDSIISRLYFFENVYRKSYFPLKDRNANRYKLVHITKCPNEYIASLVRGEGYRQF